MEELDAHLNKKWASLIDDVRVLKSLTAEKTRETENRRVYGKYWEQTEFIQEGNLLPRENPLQFLILLSPFL